MRRLIQLYCKCSKLFRWLYIKGSCIFTIYLIFINKWSTSQFINQQTTRIETRKKFMSQSIETRKKFMSQSIETEWDKKKMFVSIIETEKKIKRKHWLLSSIYCFVLFIIIIRNYSLLVNDIVIHGLLRIEGMCTVTHYY